MPPSRRLLNALTFATSIHYVKMSAIAVVLAMALFYLLGILKTVINRGIGGRNFPQVFFGYPLDQYRYFLALICLFCLCGLLVVILRWLSRHHLTIIGLRLTEAMVRSAAQPRGDNTQILRESGFAQSFDSLHKSYFPTLATPILSLATLAAILSFIMIQDPVLCMTVLLAIGLRALLVARLQRRMRPRLTPTATDAVGIGAFLLALRQLRDSEQQLDLGLRYFMFAMVLFIGGYLIIAGNLSFGSFIVLLPAIPEIELPLQQWTEWCTTNRFAQRAYESFLGSIRAVQVPDRNA
jgi:hypothetical protein